MNNRYFVLRGVLWHAVRLIIDRQNKIYMKKILTYFLVGVCMISSVEAGARVEVKPSVSLVSSYVWRGMYQSGAALQPGMTLNAYGLSLGVWGSTDFTGQGHKEFDINLSYSVAGLTVSLSDYWWAGESGIKNDHISGLNHYFDYCPETTAHILEGGLSYLFPFEKFPLRVSWYTMFWGGDRNRDDKGTVKQSYSSYFELSCPFSVGKVVLTPALGCSPWTSHSCYLNDGFAVNHVSLKGECVFKITDSFSLPLFVQAIWNPDRQDIHCVFGLSF